jgi:hypothetical protein
MDLLGEQRNIFVQINEAAAQVGHLILQAGQDSHEGSGHVRFTFRKFKIDRLGKIHGWLQQKTPRARAPGVES